MRHFFFFFSLILIISCKSNPKENQQKEAYNRPNVLWIVTEDISPTLSFYGDNTAKTPNLDRLAAESMIYDNAFTTVGVCAPSRSSIVTGMHPTSIGTIHMRTGQDVMSWGKRTYTKTDRVDVLKDSIIQYSAVIPDNIKCFTEYLRAAGYFCTNNQKTDYQFAAPITAWNQNNIKAHWRNRPENTPFFSVFNIGTTHESQLWKKKNLPLTVSPDDVKVPPYLPDNDMTRKTIARHYSNVELMDAEVGALIKQLKEDGLYDNTIVFFYSDHGGPLPRQKREILDSGLKVPFLVKGTDNKRGRTGRLISFVDLAPTILSITGVKPPDYMEGKAFMGVHDTEKRDYVFGSSDRFDEFTDRIRSVRNKKYLYLRNSFSELPKYKDVAYRKNIPMMPNFLKLRDESKLNAIQSIWFKSKTAEELYDCEADPYNIKNLAEDPEYKSILVEMRTVLDDFQNNKIDYGKIPEAELISQMWPNFEQPTTEDVLVNTVKISQGKSIMLSCATKGASIAYIISDKPNEEFDFDSNWTLYTKPIIVEKDKYLYTIANRIGYKPSEIVYKRIP